MTEHDEIAEARARRSIADRRHSAHRFLFDVLDETFDPELDIDWDAAPADDRAWLPETIISLGGTDMWDALGSTRQRELGRHELVNLATQVIYANTAQSMIEFRRLNEQQTLADDTARWGLKNINLRTISVAMFSRLVTVTGLRPHARRRVAWALERFTLLTPEGPLTSSLYWLFESSTRALSMALATTDHLQPHVLQVASLHLRSTDRHHEHAETEFIAAMRSRRRLLTPLYSVITALMLLTITAGWYSADVYRAVGLDPRDARAAARRSSAHERRLDAIFGEFVRSAAGHGLFADRVSRHLLRRAGEPLVSAAAR